MQIIYLKYLPNILLFSDLLLVVCPFRGELWRLLLLIALIHINQSVDLLLEILRGIFFLSITFQGYLNVAGVFGLVYCTFGLTCLLFEAKLTVRRNLI